MIPTEDGHYRLTTMFRGDAMCLDVVNGGPRNNQTQLTPCGNFSGQLWRITNAGADRYRLTTMFRGENFCLDVVNGGSDNNATHLVPCGDFSGQFWRLMPTGTRVE